MLQRDFWWETFKSNITFKNLGTPIKLTVREPNVSAHYIILENISLLYQLSWLKCKGVITFNTLLKMYLILLI